MTGWDVGGPAEALHRDMLVWDNIFPFGNNWLLSWMVPGANIGSFEPKYINLARYGRSGANIVGLTVSGDDSDSGITMRILAKELSFIRENPDTYILIETADDVLRAMRENKVGLILNFQGTDPLDRNLEMVEVYRRLGVRQMLIAYNRQNHAGCGCHEPVDPGLSSFGRALVGELNRCGIIVDCSHTGYRTTMDVMEISSDPVVFSHSNAKEINAHDRNITREQAEACARTGGVVGVVGFDGFLRDNVMSVSNIVEQIDYYCDIIGSDHVGLGLDWMFWEAFPEFLAATAGRYKPGQYDTEIRFSPPEVLPQITETLMARGYTEQDIRKIMGENWLRVARAVW